MFNNYFPKIEYSCSPETSLKSFYQTNVFNGLLKNNDEKRF